MSGRWSHPDEMFDELTAGQYQDWLQFHSQFNIAADKPDFFWALHIADFRNANKGEGTPDTRPIDVLPWIDPYGDDDAFLASIRGVAAAIESDAKGS